MVLSLPDFIIKQNWESNPNVPSPLWISIFFFVLFIISSCLQWRSTAELNLNFINRYECCSLWSHGWNEFRPKFQPLPELLPRANCDEVFSSLVDVRPATEKFISASKKIKSRNLYLWEIMNNHPKCVGFNTRYIHVIWSLQYIQYILEMDVML